MLNTVASISMQQQSHSMQNQTQHQTVHGYTHKKCETYNSTVRCVHVFSTKQHACITTSIYPLQETLTEKQVPASRKLPGGVNNTLLLGSIVTLTLLQTCSTHHNQIVQLLNQMNIVVHTFCIFSLILWWRESVRVPSNGWMECFFVCLCLFFKIWLA